MSAVIRLRTLDVLRTVDPDDTATSPRGGGAEWQARCSTDRDRVLFPPAPASSPPV